MVNNLKNDPVYKMIKYYIKMVELKKAYMRDELRLL